ncbi:hypothetical protein [Thermoactinomyces sp. DSM 45892]|uniref:hypothetical protein n=1 Tax=Thermoactinomyces sp. DSM 45892 TaxID=1882753 RepID=UPI0008988509|nr:hypothetical protein [Thermoactinomyces sp. DSM 45892]SDY46015.1 hypothetical protein SAMN05444416_1056 [Thermoactinomyces sp. DSM 45892]
MKKIVATGLALSMLMGGAVLSSSNVHASSPKGNVNAVSSQSPQGDIEPKSIGGLFARGFAGAVGFVAGEKIGSALFGRSHTTSNYDYGQVQEAFDQ